MSEPDFDIIPFSALIPSCQPLEVIPEEREEEEEEEEEEPDFDISAGTSEDVEAKIISCLDPKSKSMVEYNNRIWHYNKDIDIKL